MSDVAQGVSGPRDRAGELAASTAVRHPHDPDPARSTKAAAVLALGVAALVTGPIIAGIIPATVGLALAREARADLVAGRGYLTGSRPLRIGRMLALVGLGLAVTALVLVSVLLLIWLANGGVRDYPSTSD